MRPSDSSRGERDGNQRRTTREDGGGASSIRRVSRGLLAAVLVVGLVSLAGPTVTAAIGDAVDGSMFADDEDGADVFEDGETVIAEDHVEAIEEAGSVTTALSIDREEGSRTVGIARTTNVDFEDEALFADNSVEVSLYGGFVESQPLRLRQYETPDGVYTRTTSSLVDGNVTDYDPPNGSWAGEDVDRQLYAAVLEDAENLSWSREGRETHDGVEVVRYELDDVEDLEGSEFELAANVSEPEGVESDWSLRLSLANVTVEDVEGTMLVDTDGVVREITYEVDVVEDGDDVTYTASLSFSDVGNTSVSRPEWTADADR